MNIFNMNYITITTYNSNYNKSHDLNEIILQ